MHDIAELQRKFDTAKANLEGAKLRFDDASKALRDAQHANALAAGHPWLGKRVSRDVTNYRGTRTQRGIVHIYDPNDVKMRGLRQLYRPAPGEPIVITASGKTGWKLTGERYRNEAEWALEPGQEPLVLSDEDDDL